MPRAAERSPGSPTPGVGLHALAALVDQALVAMGSRPAFAIATTGGGAPDGPLGAFARSQTTETVDTPTAGGGRRGAGGSRGTAGRPPAGAAAGEPEPDFVDEQHVETWRLVTLAQAGDGEAFGQLYDRYVDVVYRFIYYRVNDRGLAEDFTSETFLRALRRITTISYQGRDIGAWFVTIARNIVLDHMKSARHRLEVTTSDTIEGRESAPSPEAAVLDSLTSERLMAAVRQLGDEQRECVMLRFIQGFSVSETAAVMGKNDGAIKALQHRAVRKLAELVGGELR